jgi:23S rRNA (guanosine2251-2'-O)-methyltransferase
MMREIIYGRHAVEECLVADRRRIFAIFVTERTGLSARSVLRQVAEQKGIPINFVAKDRLDQMAGRVNHQGIAAEAAPYPYCDINDVLDGLKGTPNPVLLLLDCLQDPQNLGTLIRCAEAVGAAGVVLPKNRSVGVTPAVVNASAGAVEHVQVALVTNLVRTMGELKRADFWLVGLEDEQSAQRYDQADLKRRLGLVVGGEGQGLGRLVKETCDYLVRVPMMGRVTSLNASIAGSIVLYEAWRQREADNEM